MFITITLLRYLSLGGKIENLVLQDNTSDDRVYEDTGEAFLLGKPVVKIEKSERRDRFTLTFEESENKYITREIHQTWITVNIKVELTSKYI